MLHMIRFVLCFIAFQMFATGCKSRQQGREKTAVAVELADSVRIPADSLLVAIQRGACFGACPQFKATVYKSGFAVYEGEKNVKKLGKWTSFLSPEKMNSLLSAIRGYKMEEKDSAYVNKYLADFPAYYLWISDKKPRKEILVNHEAPPVDITEFTTLLQRLLDEVKWSPASGKARHDEE